MVAYGHLDAYDPTQYQVELFVAPSFDVLIHDTLAWTDTLP